MIKFDYNIKKLIKPNIYSNQDNYKIIKQNEKNK